MTVSSSTAKAGPYAGAGSAGPFTVPFRFLAASHLQVIRTSTAGIDTTLTLTTDYTVSGVGASSGSVTLTTALAAGEKLTIVRNVPFTQLADYVNNDAFPAESHEDALDLLTMQTQQLKERVDASLTLPATVSGVDTSLPAPESLKLLGWNQAANALQNIDGATLATIVAFGTSRADVFVGNGSQTQFTLSSNPGVLANLDVAIGGVTQTPGVDYTFSGTTLTFLTGAPANGVRILARYFQALTQGTTDAAATQYLASHTGSVSDRIGPMLDRKINLFTFLTDAQRAAVTARTLLVDVTSGVLAAVAASKVLGGVPIEVPAGAYRISSTITVDGSGVVFLCAGGDTVHDNGAGSDAATKFVWFGASGGTVFHFCSPSGAGNAKRTNQGLIDCEIDCQDIAGIGLLLTSVNKGTWSKIHIATPTIAALKTTSLGNANLAEASDTQLNLFDRITWRCIDSATTRDAHGIWLTCHTPGPSDDSNTSLNTFVMCSGQNSGASGDTGVGILIEAADNNIFDRCAVQRVLGTATPGIELRGNSSTDGNHFRNCSSPLANGIVIKGTASGFSRNPIFNSFWSMDMGNGTLYPTADTGCRFTWHGDTNVFERPMMRALVLADSVAQAQSQHALLTTETLRVFNGSNAHVVLDNGTQRWGVNIDAVTGDLRLLRIAGSGAVNVGDGAPVKINGKTVTEGAVDSGGTGFRVLRVVN